MNAARGGKALTWLFIIAMLTVCSGQAQDLTMQIQTRNESDNGVGFGPPTEMYLYLQGDQLRFNREDYGMLIRLSGPYAGLLILDHARRGGIFLPMELIAPVEEGLTARGDYEYMPSPSDYGWSATEVQRRVEGFCNEGCRSSVTVIENGQSREMRIAPVDVGWNALGVAALPMGFAEELDEVPAEYLEYVRVYVENRGRALVDPQIPGGRQLAAFFEKFAEVNFNPANSTHVGDAGTIVAVNLVSSLTSAMQEIAADGVPKIVMSISVVEIVLGGPLEHLTPMMAGLFQGEATVSVHELIAVSTDPIQDTYAVFFDGGMPNEYVIEDLTPTD